MNRNDRRVVLTIGVGMYLILPALIVARAFGWA